MPNGIIDRKKQIEARYLEEARLACPLFPPGLLVAHERPDFLLQGAAGTIGIEVTELCREEPRAEAERLAKVPHKAKALYSARADAAPVDLSLAFSNRTGHLRVGELARSLADFVYAGRRPCADSSSMSVIVISFPRKGKRLSGLPVARPAHAPPLFTAAGEAQSDEYESAP